jgi:hypothetical protein
VSWWPWEHSEDVEAIVVPDGRDEAEVAQAEGADAVAEPRESRDADAEEWVDEPFGHFVEVEPGDEPSDAIGSTVAQAVVRRGLRWPWGRRAVQDVTAQEDRTAEAVDECVDHEDAHAEMELVAAAPDAVASTQLNLLDDVPEVVDAAQQRPRRVYRSLHRSRKLGRIGRMASTPASSRVVRGLSRVGRLLRIAGLVVLTVVVLMAALYGLVVGVNAFARWNARRVAAQSGPVASNTLNNVLIIGVRDGQAVGFAALKAERASRRVLGIAIPDGAFVEVPGQGFERLADSYVQGPEISRDAVSNYLMVQFGSYVVVSGDAYQAIMKNQDVSGVMAQVQATDLTAAEQADLTKYFSGVKTKDVWLVPLPVKPISVGDQQYFEPQRQQIADLLLKWWGVKIEQEKSMPRVIVYNGVGTPGIAGKAAQQLIRKGYRVVDSGNADNFKHKTTLVLLYHGTEADAQSVRDILGAGQVAVQSAPQDMADIIVIIGADYRPPADVTEVTQTLTP